MWVGCCRRRRLRHMTRARPVSRACRRTQTQSKYLFVRSCQLFVMLMWHFSTWWIDFWRSLFLIVSFYPETVLHMPTSSRREQQFMSLSDLNQHFVLSYLLDVYKVRVMSVPSPTWVPVQLRVEDHFGGSCGSFFGGGLWWGPKERGLSDLPSIRREQVHLL